MPTFDLTDPALREQWGLQRNYSEIIPKQTYFRRVRRQYRSRAELTALVLETVKSSTEPLSRREIANQMGVSKNNYLRDSLAELVALGRLREFEDDWHGIPMFRYEAADAAQ